MLVSRRRSIQVHLVHFGALGGTVLAPPDGDDCHQRRPCLTGSSTVLFGTKRYGADSSSRKSALSALYLAAGRLLSEPCMTTSPSVVHTRHRHVRLRFFKSFSKTGNWSGIAIVPYEALTRG